MATLRDVVAEAESYKLELAAAREGIAGFENKLLEAVQGLPDFAVNLTIVDTDDSANLLVEVKVPGGVFVDGVRLAEAPRERWDAVRDEESAIYDAVVAYIQAERQKLL